MGLSIDRVVVFVGVILYVNAIVETGCFICGGVVFNGSLYF